MLICEQCNCEVKPFEGVHLTVKGGSVFLCSKCYNQRAAEYAGVEFTHVTFDPNTFSDIDGQDHTFHFTTHLFGDHVSIEAFEQMEGGDVEGYHFCLSGTVEGGVTNLFDLFGQLIARIKRGLSRKHLEIGNTGRHQITGDGIVRGHITSDVHELISTPVVVIDGKEFSWKDFGKMVMAYEGFNFRLDLIDRSEEA